MTDKQKKKAEAVAAKSSAKGKPLAAELLGVDASVGGIESTDLFALGGDFQSQTSSDDLQKQRAMCQDNKGDELTSTLYDTKNQVSVTYSYCADTGNIALGSLFIGKVAGGFHIDGVQVAYTNTGYPTITVTGHSHGTADHVDGSMVEYKPSIVLPAGFGAPDLFANSNVDAKVQNVTYTLAAEHVDVPNNVGEHLAGNNKNGTENITATYYGDPTLTTTGWDLTSDANNDSNADFDQVSINATKGLARFVAP